jgi:hypothetical protein
MRFSAAIHQIVQRDSASTLGADVRDADDDDVLPQGLDGELLPEPPPPDLDQRVRLSGEW